MVSLDSRLRGNDGQGDAIPLPGIARCRNRSRPPGMVGVQILQEQKSAYRPGMVGVQILQEQKSAYRPGMVEVPIAAPARPAPAAYMPSVAILSGTKICLPPGTVGVPIAAPARPAPAAYMPSVAILSGTKICLPSMEGGSANNASLHGRNLLEQCRSNCRGAIIRLRRATSQSALA